MIEMRFRNPHCVYVTRHEDGRYYIGKGKTNLVVDKKYVGSGTKLLKAISDQSGVQILNSEIAPAFAYANGWNCEILETFRFAEDAYSVEAILIQAHINDPLCLNIAVPSGKRQIKRLHSGLNRTERKALGRKQSRQKRIQEHADKMERAHQAQLAYQTRKLTLVDLEDLALET